MLGFTGCSAKKYNIDYNGQMTWYTNAKEAYRAGARVKLCYPEKYIGTDTDYTFLLDGEKLSAHYKEGKGFIVEFTMPEHDVSLIVSSVNSMVRDNSEPTSVFEKHPTLSFDSFDGGGYNYTAKLDDGSIVEFTCEHRYAKPNHAELEGSSYNVVYTFTGLKEGRTRLKIEARSPIIEPEDYYYEITVDADLNVNIKQT